MSSPSRGEERKRGGFRELGITRGRRCAGAPPSLAAARPALTRNGLGYRLMVHAGDKRRNVAGAIAHRQPCCGWPHPAGRACQRRTGRREEPRACAPRRPVVAQGHRRRRQVHLREPGLGGSARTVLEYRQTGRAHRKAQPITDPSTSSTSSARPTGPAGRSGPTACSTARRRRAAPSRTCSTSSRTRRPTRTRPTKTFRPTRARATRTGSPRCPTATS